MVSTTPHLVKPRPAPPSPAERRADREAAAILFGKAAHIEWCGGNPRRVRIYRRAARVLVARAGGVVDGGTPTP